MSSLKLIPILSFANNFVIPRLLVQLNPSRVFHAQLLPPRVSEAIMLTILLGQVKLLSKIVVKLFVVSVVVDPTTRLTNEREEESRERKDRVSFVWRRHGGEEAVGDDFDPLHLLTALQCSPGQWSLSESESGVCARHSTRVGGGTRKSTWVARDPGRVSSRRSQYPGNWMESLIPYPGRKMQRRKVMAP